MNTSAPRGRFVAPDEIPSGRMDWNHVARLARRAPDPAMWYRVPGFHARAVASHVRAGRIAAFRPAGSWEARYAATDDPKAFQVFVRPAPAEDDTP